MENFMKHDFQIEKIQLAILVKAGTGAMVHRNRPSHGLAYFLGGEASFDFDGKKLKATENTIVYFPKGSNYLVREKAPFDCYAINFHMPEGVKFAPFALKIKNQSACLESFKSARSLWNKKSMGYQTKVKAELYNVLYHMQSEYSLPYGDRSVISEAVEYIHSRYYKEPISVEELARRCGISTVHLRNHFIKAFAVPPVRYINDLRMARAKELLSSRMHTVSQVAHLSGFRDESYFCREFKKRFHLSPREYAKSTREQ